MVGRVKKFVLDEIRSKTGWRPTSRRGNVWLGISDSIHNLRDLRAALVGVAYAAVADPGSMVMLMLTNSRMGIGRLDEEVARFRSLLAPKVAERCYAYSYDEFHLQRDWDEGYRHWVDEVVSGRGELVRRSSSRSSVLGLIFSLTLRGVYKTSISEIVQATGASRPTVVAALQLLQVENAITSDRGAIYIYLERFPHGPWLQWVHRYLETQRTVNFVIERGARPAWNELLDGVRRLDRVDVGVGGTLGAMRHCPHLQLDTALPLHLSVRGSADADLAFVRRIHPLLTPQSGSSAPVALSLHFLDRPNPLFSDAVDGLRWADAVACLLDLHRQRLLGSAEAMLQDLIGKVAAQDALL
jgi:hypothetical protein